ncbi:unnamed protein product [Arctogadus glacialis]
MICGGRGGEGAAQRYDSAKASLSATTAQPQETQEPTPTEGPPHGRNQQKDRLTGGTNEGPPHGRNQQKDRLTGGNHRRTASREEPTEGPPHGGTNRGPPRGNQQKDRLTGGTTEGPPHGRNQQKDRLTGGTNRRTASRE